MSLSVNSPAASLLGAHLLLHLQSGHYSAGSGIDLGTSHLKYKVITLPSQQKASNKGGLMQICSVGGDSVSAVCERTLSVAFPGTLLQKL